MTDIEKIREMTEAVRKDHFGRMSIYPEKNSDKDGRLICDECCNWHPCPTLKLAEDRLKLSEALDDIERAARDFREIPSYAYADNEAACRAFDGHDDAAQAAAKALSEVAGGQK